MGGILAANSLGDGNAVSLHRDFEDVVGVDVLVVDGVVAVVPAVAAVEDWSIILIKPSLDLA